MPAFRALLLSTAIGVITAAVSVPLAGCGSAATRADERAPPAADTPLFNLEQHRAAPTAFAPLIASPDAAVRARVALALGRLEHRGALPVLLPLLADNSPAVRHAALFSLGQLDLALDPKVAGHEETRLEVEQALVAALAAEQAPDGRSAAVKALGRVAGSVGLEALIDAADAGDPEAFTALGVSGARRAASLRNNARLLAVVDKALRGTDGPQRTAAAYTAFRQKLQLPPGALQAALAGDAQARIFAVRAGATQQDADRAAVVAAGLVDADWRVVAEAARQSVPAQLPQLVAALDDAVKRITAAQPSGAHAHVVREVCQALAGFELPPAQLVPPLDRAVAALVPLRDHHRAAACTCAVAKDAIEGDASDVTACAEGADDAWVGKLNVQLVSRRRMASKEKVALLDKLLADDERRVRMAAAAALVEEASPVAVEAAVARLARETDAGVTSSLLELVGTDEQQGALSEPLLLAIAERLWAGTSFEDVEPLLAVARVARGRDTPAMRALSERLAGHPHPSVRDAARGTPQGDRTPGPRARPVEVPNPSSLPAWALLKTNRGDVRIALLREEAPATVQNFVALARAGTLNGTPFHRVIADFVAQGGDPRGDGSGGPGYSIGCERTDERFLRGAVGMAHAGLDTAGSQFFLTHSDQPHLDGRYTLFGRVVGGMDVMDALQPDDVLNRIEITFAAPPR